MEMYDPYLPHNLIDSCLRTLTLTLFHLSVRAFIFFHLSVCAVSHRSDGSNPAGDDASHEAYQVEDEEDNYVLGPVIEEALLLILSALGVLHSAENKFLVLPMDSEPFRSVIYETYILERGGGTVQYWHSLLIQHFQTEPNSLRKCEELPWHLKICRKWGALKDTLCELKTFDMMYNNDLKEELMDYWLLLTEGPLFVNERHDDSSEDEDPSSSSFILKGIDHATAYNMSYSEVRRLMYKNQVQPFDVVEELNKSLETWVSANPHKPPVAAINKTIIQIARFLAEFSKLAKPYPHFHRIGVQFSALEIFGISIEGGLSFSTQSDAPYFPYTPLPLDAAVVPEVPRQ
jgi:hypothetical protein